MNPDTRPAWVNREVTEAQGRFLRDHMVTTISYRSNIGPEWQSETWVVFNGVSWDGKSETNMKFPEYLPRGVEYRPSYGKGLIQIDPSIKKAIDAIDDWDQKHNAELRQFRKLKEKLFG